jgi:hypothetical protein
MAQNTTYSLTTAWTLISDVDVTSVTFQNLTQGGMFLAGTAGTGAPTAGIQTLSYGAGQGERNVAVADLFPGVAGVNRLWARVQNGTGTVFVSNA